MSPKIKFSKDLIREEAYKIAVKHGIYEISARNLANVMGCSVAPIYSNYSNIDELLNEIKEKVQTLMWSYSSKKYTNMAFFNMGIGQILFAKEYPELMKEIMIQKINTCYIISNITGVIYLRKALLLVTQRVNKKDSRCIAIILIMTINISLQKLLYEEINHEKKSQTFSCYITAQYYNHPYVFEDS